MITKGAGPTITGDGTGGATGPTGPAGPQGPAGPAGSTGATGSVVSSTISPLAGEALSGQTAVYIASDGKAYKADNSNAVSRFVLGITANSASANAAITIQTDGILTEASWNWSGTEVVWLGSNGLLTQTVPLSGYLVQVGIPAGPTKLRIEPQLVAKV